MASTSRNPYLADHLAERIRALRKARGLSLEAVAQRSGVSRSMLSQIERGGSSPTVATLWNLAAALDADLAELLGGAREGRIRTVRRDVQPVIEGYGEGCTLHILSPPEQSQSHEVYDVTIAPDGALRSEAHATNCREHLTVLQGEVRIEAGTREVRLRVGDTAIYSADVPHAICAGTEGARVFLIVRWPDAAAI